MLDSNRVYKAALKLQQGPRQCMLAVRIPEQEEAGCTARTVVVLSRIAGWRHTAVLHRMAAVRKAEYKGLQPLVTVVLDKPGLHRPPSLLIGKDYADLNYKLVVCIHQPRDLHQVFRHRVQSF
jgi:hypothetical protein